MENWLSLLILLEMAREKGRRWEAGFLCLWHWTSPSAELEINLPSGKISGLIE